MKGTATTTGRKSLENEKQKSSARYTYIYISIPYIYIQRVYFEGIKLSRNDRYIQKGFRRFNFCGIAAFLQNASMHAILNSCSRYQRKPRTLYSRNVPAIYGTCSVQTYTLYVYSTGIQIYQEFIVQVINLILKPTDIFSMHGLKIKVYTIIIQNANNYLLP